MRLGVLLHERDLPLERTTLFIRVLVDAWREEGIDVRVFHGIREWSAVDLLIPQVDLTITPVQYRRFIESQPRVLNQGLYDISKRRVSSNIVSRDTTWRGPVIVKTDLNYGGRPERRLATRSRGIFARVARAVINRKTRAESSIGYQVFDRVESVPAEFWRRSDLIVERFLPETEGELYFLRSWVFLGDRGMVIRIGSPDPCVKASTHCFREEIHDVPEAVVEFRTRFGVDYGKIDFVIADGTPVVLDLNRTPGIALPLSENHLRISRDLARGIGPFL